MARLVYLTNVSLDGYVEDDRGRLDWTEPEAEVFAAITELVRPIGTFLYGRRLYETMSVWETDPALGAGSPEEAEFAALWVRAGKVVYSTTLERVWTERTRLERTFDPDAVRAMKSAVGADLAIGGADLAAQAVQAGVVDEVQFLVHPVLLGGGRPALTGAAARLDLVDARRLGRGVVHLRYAVVR